MEAASSLIAGTRTRSIGPPTAAAAEPAPATEPIQPSAPAAPPQPPPDIATVLASSSVLIGDVVAAADLALSGLYGQSERNLDAEARLAALRAEAADLVTVLRRAREVVERPAAAPVTAPAEPADAAMPASDVPAPPAATRASYAFAGRSRNAPVATEGRRKPCSAAAVRLLATQMAVSGVGCEEIERRLRAEFGVSDPALIVPDILAKTAVG